MSHVESVQFGIEIKCLKTVLNEPRPQVLPVVLSVEIILSVDVLVCLINCCYLPHFNVRYDPSYVRIGLDNFFPARAHLAVTNCHYFLQRVGVELEERKERQFQQLYPGRNLEYDCQFNHL